MKPVAETITALGVPVFMHTVGDGSSPSAVIARWRHSGAEIDIGASDIVRVAISLQDGQHVQVQTDKAASRANIKAGSVSVLPSHQRTKVAIQGEADILQIFLPTRRLKVDLPVWHCSTRTTANCRPRQCSFSLRRHEGTRTIHSSSNPVSIVSRPVCCAIAATIRPGPCAVASLARLTAASTT